MTVSVPVRIIPSMPTVAELLSRFEREQIASFIEVAITLIDSMDGDENLEDDGGSEPDDFDEDDDPREVDESWGL